MHAGAIMHAENSTDPVRSFTSMDPEGDSIEWDVRGLDAADFTHQQYWRARIQPFVGPARLRRTRPTGGSVPPTTARITNTTQTSQSRVLTTFTRSR